MKASPYAKSVRHRPGSRDQAPLRTDSLLFRAAIERLRRADGVLESHLRGGSMGDAIPAGARIRIDIAATQAFRTGDVIAFLVDGGICVHRIAYRGRWRDARNHVLTRGDACVLADLPVHAAAILGRVSAYDAQGSWSAPGNLEPRGSVSRLLRAASLAAIAGAIETDVALASWLTVQLRRAKRLCLGAARRLRLPLPRAIK